MVLVEPWFNRGSQRIRVNMHEFNTCFKFTTAISPAPIIDTVSRYWPESCNGGGASRLKSARSPVCLMYFPPKTNVNICRPFWPRSLNLRHGLVVRILGSHPRGPGSIPGTGTFFFLSMIFFNFVI